MPTIRDVQMAGTEIIADWPYLDRLQSNYGWQRFYVSILKISATNVNPFMTVIAGNLVSLNYCLAFREILCM